MRILSLHAKFSSFFSVCFRETVERYGVQIRLVCSKPETDAPFSDSIYEYSKVESVLYREDFDDAGLMAQIEDFQPDAIMTSGWMFRSYLKVCKKYRRRGGLVIAFSDTQFEGRLKQKIGALLASYILKPSIDVICVAGERQRQYAAKLGYRGSAVWEPMLCCDWHRFSSFRIPVDQRKREFLYVGRLVPSKGMRELIDAYQRYRSHVESPWLLRCVGDGEMKATLNNQEGINAVGFVQPDNLPADMSKAGCFVFPSLFEPWGVAMQEAAALGLPIIASEAAGASVHLLRDGWNGYLVEPKSVESLLAAMLAIHHSTAERQARMGENSYILSKQFTPERWARQLVVGITNWRERNIGQT